MRIGILSDTHDRVARTAIAVTTLIDHGAEVLIHCGDLTGTAIIAECARLPCFYVFGNNDFDEGGLERAMVESGGTCLKYGGEIGLGGKRIAVTHGDSERELRRLAAGRPSYLLFGHSHRTSDRREGATRWINPGALHRAPAWTVALLHLETDALQFLNISDG